MFWGTSCLTWRRMDEHSDLCWGQGYPLTSVSQHVTPLAVISVSDRGLKILKFTNLKDS